MSLGFLAVALGLLVLLAVRRAEAKSVSVPFNAEYQSTVLGLEEGMPENSCSGVVQGPDGALWLGTFRGLTRFNGSQLRRFAPKDLPELGTEGIVNLHRDPENRIWLSTFSGLVSLEGGRWRRWGVADGWQVAGEYARSYAGRVGHGVAISRFGGQVYRFEKDRFQELAPVPEGTGGSWVAMDDQGGLYVVRGGFAGRYVGNRWERLSFSEGADLDLRWAGAGQSRDGTALIFGRGTVFRFRGGEQVGRLDLKSPVEPFWQSMEDSKENLWLPAIGSGVYRVGTRGEVKHLRRADGLAHDGGARAVFEDDAGGMWIGSGVGGVACLRRPQFRYLGEWEGLADRVTQSIETLEDGRVLLGSYGAGIRVFDGRQTQPLKEVSMMSRRIRALLRDREGGVLVGGYASGVVRWKGGVVERVGEELFPTNSTVSTLFQDGRGRLWIGGGSRVACLEGGRLREVPMPGAREWEAPTYFGERPDGVVLLVRENQVWEWREGRGAERWLELPAGVRVSGLVTERSGRIWIGTHAHGLFGYDGRELRQVLAATGLPADSALSLILDDAGWLWFGSGRRVVRADTANLWRAAGGTEELSVHWFSESDGLRALDFPAGTQPTVTKDRHGRLWFALVRGAAMVDPSTLEFRDRPPPVRVESVRYVPRGARQPVEVSLDGLQGDPVLPAGIRQVQFGFTALDFAAPERHRFRVRLVGDGAPWQDVGHDREVAFFEFPPGRHELWVQAAGSDGVWNREGARLAFVVEPFFWQTVGFRVALGMGLAGLAAVAFRGANARRERQLRTQEALRRLATELTAALEPESMARRVAACCRDLFACDGFAVVLVDRLGKIRFAAWARADGEVIPVAVRGDAVAGPLPPSLVPVLGGQSLLIRRREPVLGLPTQPPWAPETADLTVASWMAVPIHWEGAVVGLVSVQSRPRRRYGGDDLDQLQMLAAHCGAAIARMEAEQTRRENEQRLRLAMEVAGIGSWEVDLGRGRLEASPEADAVYGRPVGELSGPVENLWRLAPDSEAVAIQLAFENIVTGQAMALDRVHRVVSPGGAGADRWVEVKAFVCGEGGSRRLIGITADITRRRLMELEREGWEEQLRQSQKLEAIGTLAGGIAHDFNNILMAILGNVEMSKIELSEGHPVREGLDEIQRSGLRARDLVQRILAFSRPQEQRFEVVELPGLVAEVVKLMRPTLPAGVEIAVIEEREVPPVLADASQLHQVLVNLGTNAWHACAGRSGRIEIRLSRVEIDGEGGRRAGGLPAGIYARMEVADNGKGISAEVLPRIFDPFFTTKGPGQGTGLGLSVVHAVVKSHGGAVTVQSEPGRGACFAVFLPATVALRPKPESPASPALSPRPVEGACVLYVDDEKSLVRLAERCLGREGYRVVTREGAAEALETYRSEPGRFDVVVTDLAMPGMSGLELSREILRLRPEARIILASGNLDPADVEEAGRMGIFSVLQKPFVARELLSALAQALAPGSSDGRKQG